jgi:AhpD family alkylhydroperoxidase
MTRINVPTKEEVSTNNQALFDKLEKGLGFVPNLYATFAHSENALGSYLQLQNVKSSLKAKERAVINLVVSYVNGCRYCQSAHTALGKMNGFTEEQILELRGGSASFNSKLNALAAFTKEVAKNRGQVSSVILDQFFREVYTKENLVDALVIIGDKTIANYLHNIGQFDIDFPVAPELVEETV